MTVRVLVVDDASYIRRLVAEIISDYGNGWTLAGEAADGREAIEVADKTQPDLVLLDLSMPVMDGLEALPGLRQSAPRATLVVLTGFPSAAAHDAALEAGADGYLEKSDLVASMIPRLKAILDEVSSSD